MNINKLKKKHLTVAVIVIAFTSILIGIALLNLNKSFIDPVFEDTQSITISFDLQGKFPYENQFVYSNWPFLYVTNEEFYLTQRESGKIKFFNLGPGHLQNIIEILSRSNLSSLSDSLYLNLSRPSNQQLTTISVRSKDASLYNITFEQTLLNSDQDDPNKEIIKQVYEQIVDYVQAKTKYRLYSEEIKVLVTEINENQVPDGVYPVLPSDLGLQTAYSVLDKDGYLQSILQDNYIFTSPTGDKHYLVYYIPIFEENPRI
jgi:hypothetical protein